MVNVRPALLAGQTKGRISFNKSLLDNCVQLVIYLASLAPGHSNVSHQDNRNVTTNKNLNSEINKQEKDFSSHFKRYFMV